MKTGIHPEYVTTEVTCSCGNAFETHSTKTSGKITVEVCSNCHPFYTGKQKILDTGGRVARFEARYGKRSRQLRGRRPSTTRSAGAVCCLRADPTGPSVIRTIRHPLDQSSA